MKIKTPKCHNDFFIADVTNFFRLVEENTLQTFNSSKIPIKFKTNLFFVCKILNRDYEQQ